MRHPLTAVLVGLLSLGTVLGVSGCSDRSRKSKKARTIRGTVTKIDLPAKQVSMRFRNDKGQEIPIDGTVTEETEVLINGVNRKLADVIVGDEVIVQGFREKEGDSVRVVATRVEVSRANKDAWQETTRGATSAPTTRP